MTGLTQGYNGGPIGRTRLGVNHRVTNDRPHPGLQRRTERKNKTRCEPQS